MRLVRGWLELSELVLAEVAGTGRAGVVLVLVFADVVDTDMVGFVLVIFA